MNFEYRISNFEKRIKPEAGFIVGENFGKNIGGKLPSGVIFSEFPTTALTVSGSVGFISVLPLYAEHPNRISGKT